MKLIIGLTIAIMAGCGSATYSEEPVKTSDAVVVATSPEIDTTIIKVLTPDTYSPPTNPVVVPVFMPITSVTGSRVTPVTGQQF